MAEKNESSRAAEEMARMAGNESRATLSVPIISSYGHLRLRTKG